MELLQLSYFCHAAETESFAQTARAFFVPASAVSQAIKRLETELGAPLFDRHPNEITLNARGKSFYLSVKSALSMLEDAQKKVMDEEVEGNVRLLVMTCRQVVNHAIRAFRSKYKGVSFHISHDVNESVDKYDLIVTDNVPFRQNYTTHAFINEEIVLALPENHPLAEKERIHIKNLSKERFITTGAQSGLFHITRRACAKGHFAPSVAIETEDPHYVLEYIATGLGIGFVPSVAWRSIIPQGVVLRPIDGVDDTILMRPSMILHNTQKYLSKATRLFLEELSQIASSYNTSECVFLP